MNLRNFGLAIALSSAASLVLTLPSHAQSGVRLSRDRQRIYVSKDVGQERWSITYDGSGVAYGLVYFPDGRSPLFVECDQAVGGAGDATIKLSCYGANQCVDQCSADEWQFIGDVELPRSFFDESPSPTPTPPPTEGPCTIYRDSCPGVPGSFAARGGEITFDGKEPRASDASLVEASLSPSFSSGEVSINAGDQVLMRFSGDSEVFEQDGRLVFASRDGSGAGTCVDSRGGPAVIIRAIEERVEFCAICGVGGPVVGRFAGRYQLTNGDRCVVTGEFRMFRTR